MQGAIGAGGQQRRRAPRLTAANFRFFLRGRNARASDGDVVIAARRRAHLQPYDRALRAFRYRWVVLFSACASRVQRHDDEGVGVLTGYSRFCRCKQQQESDIAVVSYTACMVCMMGDGCTQQALQSFWLNHTAGAV